VKVEIDENVCIGAGECEFLAPSVFQVGDDGVAHVVDLSAVDLDTLKKAEAGCPSGALRLVEE
jgi:ferredoxin